jgi:tetratricopeptide (TPR) repeat protein
MFAPGSVLGAGHRDTGWITMGNGESHVLGKLGAPEAYAEMGDGHAKKGETLEAVECYRKSLTLDPNCATAWFGLGNMFFELNDLESATLSYQNAASLQPAAAGPQYSLGRALDLQGRHQDALIHLVRACELNPFNADFWTNLGNVHAHLGNSQDALDCYDRSLTLTDRPAEAHISRAIVLLDRGDFREGWREYEYRWQRSAFKKRPFGRPQWKGESLEDQRILLHMDQGYGDAIQFARFIPEVASRARAVFLEVAAPLKELLEGLLEPGHIFVRGESLPEFDYHCPLISVAFALDLRFDSIPNKPYLSIPSAALREVQNAICQVMTGHSTLRVGLCWRGESKHAWNRLRSLNPIQLAPLATVPGVQWFVLQKDARPEELSTLCQRFQVVPLAPRHLEGFVATAALIQSLDLIISVDTVTAHLTGALGKPLWLLLPAFYEWRWHTHLKDSPWYPSARLFRQKEPGEWKSAIENVRAALEEMADRTVG